MSNDEQEAARLVHSPIADSHRSATRLPEPTLEELEAAIKTAVVGPSMVTVDGQTIQQQSIYNQIEADKYFVAKAAAKSTKRGLRFLRAVQPGAGD